MSVWAFRAGRGIRRKGRRLLAGYGGMADTTEAAGAILKILSGVQAGIDVALVAGDYTLGSGDDDDIQLFDVSLKPGHAKIAIRSGKMEIAGGSGQLRTRNGLQLDAGGPFVEIEPLDVVTVGTTRFALGPRTANWASITEAERNPDDLYASSRPARPSEGKGRRRLWTAAAVAVGVVAVVSAGVGVAAFQKQRMPGTAAALALSDKSAVEQALSQLEFHDRLTLTEDVDGTLYLTGFVDKPVERRAVLGAVAATNIPVRVRVSVLDTMRDDITNLLAEEKTDVSFVLAPDGALTLSGVILDPKQASDLIGLLREQVPGLTSVVSTIRTAATLLTDVQGLADRSQITPLVQLRLDGSLIEASGIITNEKIDSWVGFLQAYASQFAQFISLRSLVQLQNPDGTLQEVSATSTTAPTTALFLGKDKPAANDIAIDMDRLQSGKFDMSDVFANRRPAPPAKQPATTVPTSHLNLGAVLASASPASAASAATTATPAAGAPAPMDFSNVNSLGRDLIDRWQSNSLGQTADGAALKKDLDALDARGFSVSGQAPAAPLAQRYAPLLANVDPGIPDQQCWQNSHLTQKNITGALFWLDLLSVSRTLSLTDLDSAIQPLVLEAAFSPQWTAQCATAALGHPAQSAYLYEASRNPDFVHYIARDLSAFPIDIAGVNETGQRFIQTRAGRKMAEGAAPDDTSRLFVVGELGALFKRGDGYATYVYGSTLNWRTQ